MMSCYLHRVYKEVIYSPEPRNQEQPGNKGLSDAHALMEETAFKTLDLLSSPSEEERQTALKTLSTLPDTCFTRKVVNKILQLIRELSEDTYLTVRQAFSILYGKPFPNSNIIQDVMELLSNRHLSVRELAVQFLETLPPTSFTKEIVNYVLRLVKRSSEEKRLTAMAALYTVPRTFFTKEVVDYLYNLISVDERRTIDTDQFSENNIPYVLIATHNRLNKFW